MCVCFQFANLHFVWLLLRETRDVGEFKKGNKNFTGLYVSVVTNPQTPQIYEA